MWNQGIIITIIFVPTLMIIANLNIKLIEDRLGFINKAVVKLR